jgi:peptidoglycan/LPS O-acetylase OafA/YrhL
MVILGHTHSKFLDRIPFNLVFRNGSQGVAVFFVISGFLITHLLLKELKREGQISLKRFYLRRTFRIFPPFYVYLLVVALLTVFHVIQVHASSLVAAGTYTWNYAPVRWSADWALGHCWSLALEEQFYLLWPACMAFFGRKTSLNIAAGFVVFSPVSRIVTYYVWPEMRGHLGMMLHTHLDTIMTGCLLALMIDMDICQRFRRVALHPASPIAAILFLAAVDVSASLRWRGNYTLTAGFSLENLAIAVLVLYVVFRHESPLGKLLNLKWVRHLGTISYSLYLWQQLFAGPYTRIFPLNVVLILLCAEASYFLVERPSFKARDFVERITFLKTAERRTLYSVGGGADIDKTRIRPDVASAAGSGTASRCA